MSRKRKSHAGKSHAGSHSAASVPAARKLHPDVPVSVLAVVGMLISGYLSFAHGGESPLFCGPESGCGVIQNSSYATLLGLPTALWGFGLYVLILWTATTAPPRMRRWRQLVWLSALGFALSLYFTLVGIIALDSTCGWCLASALTMTALLVTVLVRRPESAPGMAWTAFARSLVLGTALVTGGVGAWQGGLLQPPENAELKALAEHLDASGAKYYGAFWCPNCQDQKRLFGRSADRLPYVECTPNGRAGMVAFECVAADIAAYPTWIINGRRFQQVLSIEELARYSRFDAARAAQEDVE
jgi:uncharacterized membrane protein